MYFTFGYGGVSPLESKSMINFEKFKEELTKINCNNLAVDKVTCEPVNCGKCADCLFNRDNSCNCEQLRLEWLFAEFEERTAEEMFEALGFTRMFNNSNWVVYFKETSQTEKVCFNFQDDHFSTYISEEKGQEDIYTNYELSKNELKAVVKQLKELEWI